jgi:hypothetical protein
MSNSEPRHEHELDAKLADANMFAWYVPMFRLAIKHWPISVASGLAALGLERFLRFVPWPYFGIPWWVQTVRGFVEALAYMLLIAVAYRFLAEKENVGTVNDPAATIVRAIQVAIIWIVGGAVVTLAVFLAMLAIGTALQPSSVNDFMALGALALVVGIAWLLLMPVWFSLLVASVLSTVHAVRSLENGFGAVIASLRLAFDQKWRVFWPSYLLAVLGILLFVAVIFFSRRLLEVGVVFQTVTTFVTTALGVAMTFVIERAYAPHLTLAQGGEPGAALPSRPPPGATPPRVRPPPAPVAPLPTAPGEIADLLAADMQANRVQRLVATVEHGLKADARFFAAHPDHTLAVAKRLSAAQRSDLALRLAQPYLKEHRGHRQHLTVALFVANLLREGKRLQDAAKFLAQVKALYPQEPMVDKLIKITDKAIASAAATAAAPAS